MRGLPLPSMEETTFGFEWGQVKVLRVASHEGYKVLEIKTPRRVLLVTVTPTGLIRIKEHKNE